LFFRSGAELFNAALLTVGWDSEAATAAVPGTLAFLAILGASGLRLSSCGAAAVSSGGSAAYR
jgi:hypothetical protein